MAGTEYPGGNLASCMELINGLSATEIHRYNLGNLNKS